MTHDILPEPVDGALVRGVPRHHGEVALIDQAVADVALEDQVAVRDAQGEVAELQVQRPRQVLRRARHDVPFVVVLRYRETEVARDRLCDLPRQPAHVDVAVLQGLEAGERRRVRVWSVGRGFVYADPVPRYKYKYKY